MIKLIENLLKPKVLYTVLPNSIGLEEPTYARSGDSAVDLRAAFLEEKLVIPPLESLIIPTGISIEIKKGYEGQVRSRSGLAAKETLFVLNSPGTIDSAYRGELQVILFNLGRKPFIVHRGDRVAQLAICRVEQPRFIKRSQLTRTDRQSNGLGSTGIK